MWNLFLRYRLLPTKVYALATRIRVKDQDEKVAILKR